MKTNKATIDRIKNIMADHEAGTPMRVLFVCLGNICRSPAAEGIMRDIVEREGDSDNWVIDSAGTGGYHIGEQPDDRMRLHARQRGLQLVHSCRKVSESDFDEFDMIIGMDASNIANLRRLAPTVEAEKKIVPMAAFFDPSCRYDCVPDPYYEGSEGFELVLDLLQEGCENIYKTYTGKTL